jgi:hypothetical protein
MASLDRIEDRDYDDYDSDDDYDDSVYAFNSIPLYRLHNLGIAPYVSASVRVKLKLSTDMLVKDIVFEAYLGEYEGPMEGTLPNPNLNQYSCPGEWASMIQRSGDIYELLSWISVACRSPQYDEEAQTMFLRYTDLDRIKHWTIDGEPHESTTLWSLLDVFPADEIEKYLCRPCEDTYIQQCTQSNSNPITISRPYRKCDNDCPRNKNRNSCNECCQIGRYLAGRRDKEMLSEKELT